MKKDNIASILKGIGIISVVIGHCSVKAAPIVYMYHLALFIFVSGYLYKEEKYSMDAAKHMGYRVKSVMGQYMVYSMLFLLIHNNCIAMKIYNPEVYKILDYKDSIKSYFYSLIFLYSEPVGAAFWFLPFYLVSIILFGKLVESIYLVFNKNDKLKHYILNLFCFAIGGVGIWLIENNIELLFRLENAFLLMPIVAIGHWYKMNRDLIKKYLNLPISCICIIFIIATNKISGTFIELSVARIINPWIFYPVTVAGLYVWVYAAEKLELLKVLKSIKTVLIVAGNYSLDVMALHILVFKLIDYFYLNYIDPNAGITYTFVCSVPKLWPVYLLFGIAIPIGIRKFWDVWFDKFRGNLVKYEGK